jgi:hypothetical protein
MSVAASQQVMLRVRFIEVNRQAERDLGVNWFGANASKTRGINTGNAAAALPNVSPLTQVGPSLSSGGVPLFQTLGTFAGTTLRQPFGVGLFNLAAGGYQRRHPPHSAGRERTCAQAGGARSHRSFRRYGEFSRRRRISRALRAVLVGDQPRDHCTVPAIRRAVEFRPDRPSRWNHQSEADAFGERTRLQERGADRWYPYTGAEQTGGAYDDRTARRAELRHRWSSPIGQYEGSFTSALAWFDARSRRAIPQVMVEDPQPPVLLANPQAGLVGLQAGLFNALSRSSLRIGI